MDKAIEKLGLYDIMGIWIPGATTITYYLFTLHSIITKIFNSMGLYSGFLTKTQMAILLYTLVANTIGILLHEVSKTLFELFPTYDTHRFLNRILTPVKQEIPLRSNVFKTTKKCSIKKLLIFYRIREKTKKTIRNYEFSIDNDNFDTALHYLKYYGSTNTGRVDTYHAIYALSRSLFLSFALHLALFLVECIYITHHFNAYQFVLDISLSAVFFLRTYRYYHSWVVNVLIQYVQTRKLHK